MTELVWGIGSDATEGRREGGKGEIGDAAPTVQPTHRAVRSWVESP